MPRQSGPATLLRSGVEGLMNWGPQTMGVEQPEQVEHDYVVFSVAAAFGAVLVLEEVFEKLLRCAAVL